MINRFFYVTTALCLLAAALFACSGEREPVASDECHEFFEWLTEGHGGDTTALKPIRERHFEKWSFEEFARFAKWAEFMDARKIDIASEPCSKFFKRLEEWLNTESGQQYSENYLKWLDTDEGREYR